MSLWDFNTGVENRTIRNGGNTVVVTTIYYEIHLSFGLDVYDEAQALFRVSEINGDSFAVGDVPDIGNS